MMRRNGLPPHCSWEIDRRGKRRIRFRWRKVPRSITDTPGEAKQQARQQQNDLAAQRAALEAKNAMLENRIEKLENLLALNTRLNELKRNLDARRKGRAYRRARSRRRAEWRAMHDYFEDLREEAGSEAAARSESAASIGRPKRTSVT